MLISKPSCCLSTCTTGISSSRRIKSVGGVNYSYAVKDEGKASPEPVVAIVPADTQREALSAVLSTLRPETLVLPARILELIPPRAFDQPGGTADLFEKATGKLFDPIAAATVAADIAVSGLLQPERAARLNEFHSRDSKYPDFAEIVAKLVEETWRSPPNRDGRARAIARAEQTLVVQRLMELGESDTAGHEVRAMASEALGRLANSILAGIRAFPTTLIRPRSARRSNGSCDDPQRSTEERRLSIRRRGIRSAGPAVEIWAGDVVVVYRVRGAKG